MYNLQYTFLEDFNLHTKILTHLALLGMSNIFVKRNAL